MNIKPTSYVKRWRLGLLACIYTSYMVVVLLINPTAYSIILKNTNMAKLFLLITFCIFQLSITISASHFCPLHQSLSLLNLKDTFQIHTSTNVDCHYYDDIYECNNNDPIIESKLSSWNSSTNCCSWEGVTCDESTGHVIELDLSSSGLGGVVHSNSSIFQLSHLRTLNLAYNHFQGSKISPQFRRLTHLSHLNLTSTGFEGEIPYEISQLNELVSLDLSDSSNLVLKPHVFKMLLQNMTSLREVSLSRVRIESSLPKNLSSSLTIIDLSGTQLNGTFPYHIFHLPNVQQISLGGNDFDGFFSSSENVKWNSSSSLQKLELAGVAFSGKLPETIGNLNGLKYLDLSDCELNGTLPKSFGNLTRLTHLDLSSNQLSGQIPPQILGLEHLSFLNLKRNNLDTSIPHLASNNMKMLKSLTLSFNKLTSSSSLSSILSNLTQLEMIDLSNNPLYGPIPLELCKLSSLQHVNLEQAQLYGPIPESFSNLVNLEYLNIYFNNISGPVETKTFSNLINLKYLNLESNSLSGPIFETKTLFKLEYLNLASNNFSGPIEIDALSNLVSLRELDLSSNSFSTSLDIKFINNLKWLSIIDLSFSGLTLIKENNTILPMISIDSLLLGSCDIRDLDILRSIVVQSEVYLPNNNIHGELPEWVWSNWSNVTLLDLSYNFITHIVGNKIPLEYLGYLNLESNWLKGQLPILPTSIWKLDLSSNQFHGEIKPSICDLVGSIINLSNNSLDGALPQCFGIMMRSLYVLDLHMNSLHGTIPDTFNMNCQLKGLNLGGNHFEGEVPRSLINCSSLEFLDLSENTLNDTFPTWLGNLSELRILILRSNMFYGPISLTHSSTTAFSALQILDLSYNQFTGNLPPTLFLRLHRMMSVAMVPYLDYLGDDYLLAPYNYGRYSQLYRDSMTMVLKGNKMQVERISRYMESIDFSCNHFQGKIPNSIGGLNAIQQLNLSHNNFTGQIPSQIGNLSNLESLDLSCNQLEGNIPDKFAALGFLTTMNLSNNHLTGRIPSGPQLQAIPNGSYMGNDGLCGFPLSIRCGNHEPPQPPQGGLPDEEEDEQEFFDGLTWQSVVIGYSVGICIGLLIGSLMLVTAKPKWLIRMVEEEAHRIIHKYKRRNRVSLAWNRTS